MPRAPQSGCECPWRDRQRWVGAAVLSMNRFRFLEVSGNNLGSCQVDGSRLAAAQGDGADLVFGQVGVEVGLHGKRSGFLKGGFFAVEKRGGGPLGVAFGVTELCRPAVGGGIGIGVEVSADEAGGQVVTGEAVGVWYEQEALVVGPGKTEVEAVFGKEHVDGQ